MGSRWWQETEGMVGGKRDGEKDGKRGGTCRSGQHNNVTLTYRRYMEIWIMVPWKTLRTTWKLIVGTG